jgi:hypothetical protein
LANKKIFIPAVAFCSVVLVVMIFFYEVYSIDDWVDGHLIWNSHEAYLFAGWSGMGYHATPIGYVIALIPAYFGASARPDDTHGSTLVFRITPTTIQRYVVPDIGFRAYIPSGNTIYAWDGGPLWKWEGDHFQEATEEERQKIIEVPKVTILSVRKDISDLNGWSVRNSITGLPPKSQIQLDGKAIDFFMTLQDLNREVSLDVQLPGGAREQLLHARSRLHLVGKSEYKDKFKKLQKPDASH